MTNSLLVSASSASLSSSAWVHGEVARIRHSVELPLQQCLAGRFGQEREGLRQRRMQRRGQQPVVHADRVGVGYSLIPSIAAYPSAGGGPVLDGLGAEEQASGRQDID